MISQIGKAIEGITKLNKSVGTSAIKSHVVPKSRALFSRFI